VADVVAANADRETGKELSMRKWLFVLAPALCLFVSASVYAQERTTERARRAVHPAGQIMGMDIRNTKNESLGHVQDFVVNMKDGNCVYVAMARGQVLGFGGSLFAINPQALKMSSNGEYLILDATAQEFENAKGFDQNSWPTQPDGRWGKAARGTDANARETARDNVKANDHLSRISALQGLYVYGRDDKQLGRVYDVAVNCDKHQIAYVAVHHGGTLGIGGKLVAVPFDALVMKAPALDPQRRAFYLNTTEAEFERASGTGFTSDNWPAQPNATFSKNTRQDN
jgi:sporulation protein YlmC with PRC-barrel domain